MSRKVESALVTRIRCQVKKFLEEKVHIDKRQSRRQSVLKNYNTRNLLVDGNILGVPIATESQLSVPKLFERAKRFGQAVII
jgi:hypothetical protein